MMGINYKAPYIHTEMTAPYIYLTHIAALIPGIVCGIIYYGISAIALIAVCATAFMLLDNAFGHMVRRDGIDRNYTDFSSIEAGIVYALMLPPGTSLFVALAGVLFGSFVVKQFFGGSGNNILNPACAARLCVELLFPSQMTNFKTPVTSWFDVTSLIGSSEAVVKNENFFDLSMSEILSGNYIGYIGMTCGILILLAGVYMAFKGTIRIYAPIAYLTVLTILFPLVGIRDASLYDNLRNIAQFIFASGALFIAVYALGDFTTMPSRIWGGILAGTLCALMTIILYGRVSVTCAVLAPVLATNFMSFEIDFFTKAIARRGNINQREVKVPK